MNVSRVVKWAAIGAVTLFLYGLAGTATYEYHERLFPGESTRPNREPVNESEIIGTLWPIGLPVTAGIHVARSLPFMEDDR